MKLIKKINKESLSLLLILLMASSTLSAAEATPVPTVEVAAPNREASKNNVEVRLQDDFYEYVNKDWLSTATLPVGYPALDTMGSLQIDTDNQLLKVFNTILENKDKYKSGTPERNMINFYENYLNMDKRNAEGLKPLQPYFDSIDKIKNIKDLDAYLTNGLNNTNCSLYRIMNLPDNVDNTKNDLLFCSTKLLLNDADVYNKPNETTNNNLASLKTYLNEILVLKGYSKEQASKKVNDFISLERRLAKNIMGREEAMSASDLENYYKKYSLDELDKIAPNLKLKTKIKKMYGENAKEVIMYEEDWLKDLNDIYSDKNINLLKNYIEIKLLYTYSDSASKEFKDAYDKYLATKVGDTGSIAPEAEAYTQVTALFDTELSKIYTDNYSSVTTKADVEAMVSSIKEEYKKMINDVDWMSEETKKKAIEKIDNMRVQVAYSDTYNSRDGLIVKSYSEGSSLIENMIAMDKYEIRQEINAFSKPIDMDKFLTNTQTVNAYNNYMTNTLCFPAAILQPPFYDPNRSREANLGSIGVIIAHEISHAFDTTGAQYDKNGNLAQWWTVEDYTKFQQQADKVIKFYNGVSLENGKKVNGDITAAENIADLTAMKAMLSIMKDIPDANYDEFFKAWAQTWRTIATPEYEEYVLQVDVHSPGKVRANQVLQQFQEFYDTYGIKEGDGMYVKPENRVTIY